MFDINEIIKYSKDLTLLYIEDNKDAREMTAMILDDLFYSIVLAIDGEDGLNKFKNNKIDIVITDINMPKMNGFEICTKIKELNNNIPFILLSAHNENCDFINNKAIDINNHLLKPIDIDKLYELIYKITKK